MYNEKIKEFQNKLYEMLVKLDEKLKENNIQYYLIGGTALGAIRHKGFIPWDDDIDIGVFREDFEKMEKILSDINLEGMKYCKVGENIIKNAPIGYLYDISNQSISITEVPTIDIFPIDGAPKDKISKKIQKYVSMIYHLSVSQLEAKNRGKILKKLSKIFLKFTPKFMFKIYQKVCKSIITHWKIKDSYECVNLFGEARYEKETMPISYFGKPKFIKFEKEVFPVPELTHEYLKHIYGNYMTLPKKEERKPKHKNFD